MKLFVFSILFILSPLQVMHAQPVPEDQVPELPEIKPDIAKESFDVNSVVEHLKNSFSQINSFAFAEQRSQSNEAYWTLCWKEIGNSYYHEVTSGNSNEIDNIIAFDGKRTSILHRGSNIIYIKSGERTTLMPTNLPSPLDLYSFLNVDNRFLSVKELRSDSLIWSNLAGRITYAGTQKFLDRDCIVFRFSDSFNHIMDEKSDYDVYFDADSLMPIGWKAFDKHKLMIEQFEALDFKIITDKANSILFSYPSHGRTTEYQWHGTMTTPNGVIKYIKSVRDEPYDKVEINSLSPEDVEIDPSLAKVIIDADSNVVTRLPKGAR